MRDRRNRRHLHRRPDGYVQQPSPEHGRWHEGAGSQERKERTAKSSRYHDHKWEKPGTHVRCERSGRSETGAIGRRRSRSRRKTTELTLAARLAWLECDARRSDILLVLLDPFRTIGS